MSRTIPCMFCDAKRPVMEGHCWPPMFVCDPCAARLRQESIEREENLFASDAFLEDPEWDFWRTRYLSEEP